MKFIKIVIICDWLSWGSFHTFPIFSSSGILSILPPLLHLWKIHAKWLLLALFSFLALSPIISRGNSSHTDEFSCILPFQTAPKQVFYRRSFQPQHEMVVLLQSTGRQLFQVSTYRKLGCILNFLGVPWFREQYNPWFHTCHTSSRRLIDQRVRNLPEPIFCLHSSGWCFPALNLGASNSSHSSSIKLRVDHAEYFE